MIRGFCGMVPQRAAYPCPAARYTRHIGIIPYLGALAYHEIVNILPVERGGLRMIYFTGDMVYSEIESELESSAAI